MNGYGMGVTNCGDVMWDETEVHGCIIIKVRFNTVDNFSVVTNIKEGDVNRIEGAGSGREVHG